MPRTRRWSIRWSRPGTRRRRATTTRHIRWRSGARERCGASADAHAAVAQRIDQRLAAGPGGVLLHDLDQAALRHLLELARDRVVDERVLQRAAGVGQLLLDAQFGVEEQRLRKAQHRDDLPRGCAANGVAVERTPGPQR